MVALEDVKKLKVQELRDELTALGLETAGLKAQLVERLENALKSYEEKPAAEDVAESPIAVETASKEATTLPAKQEPRTANGAERQKIPIPVPAKAAVPEKASEAEKMKSRAERFGMSTNTASADVPASKPVKKDAGNIRPAAKDADDTEKQRERARRFGLAIPTDPKEAAAKLAARAARFQSSGNKAAGAAAKAASIKPAAESKEEEAKRLKRAERFGPAVPEVQEKKLTERSKAAPIRPAAAESEEEKAKRLKRAERFGTTAPEVHEKKLTERAARFGLDTEATRAKKLEERKKRFALQTAAGS